ncbi:MAG: hypothetical protein ACYSW0_11550, partial [Planctomycetota bacterium]
GVIYDSRLSFDDLDFVTCGQNPAPAVKNHAPLRLPAPVRPLLFEAGLDVMVVPDRLKVKTPPAQCQK